MKNEKELHARMDSQCDATDARTAPTVTPTSTDGTKEGGDFPLGTCGSCGHQQEMPRFGVPMPSGMVDMMWRCRKCGGLLFVTCTTYTCTSFHGR